MRPLAGAKQKSNVMFMSCYLILCVLLYSAASAARLISFHLLFAILFSFLSLFLCVCVSVFICLEIFHLH